MKKSIFLITLLISFYSLTASAQRTDSPPTAMPGLEITRTKLFDTFKKNQLDYVFNQGKDINGLPCYNAADTLNTTVQIVGKENDLRLAECLYKLINNQDKNSLALTKLGAFIYSFAYKAGTDWYLTQLKVMSTHPDTPYTVSKNFNFARTIKLTYVPMPRSLTVTVTPFD